VAADGRIEFLGRNDYQIKIRGTRVELGEIEARLREYEGVKEAVGGGAGRVPGEKRLVAYYRLLRQRRNWTDAEYKAKNARLPESKLAGVHGAGGVCAAGEAAADGESEAGS